MLTVSFFRVSYELAGASRSKHGFISLCHMIARSSDAIKQTKNENLADAAVMDSLILR